jgi:hypothetical protein
LIPQYFKGEDFTEEVWVELVTDFADHPVCILSQEKSYEIVINTSAELSFAYYTDIDTYVEEPTDPLTTLVLNQWYHFAIVYDAALPQIQVFIDAVEVYSNQITLPLYVGNHNLLYHVTEVGSPGGFYFTNYRFWNVKMTDAELLILKDL